MKVYMGFALVLMVLAGTSVAYSLIWDWWGRPKNSKRKVRNRELKFAAL